MGNKILEEKGLVTIGYEHVKMRDFLVELEKNLGVVSITCLKLGVARRTFYNWQKRDQWFREVSDEIRKFGKEELDDIAYAGLLDLMMKRSVPAIIFYLKTRHPEFKQNKEQFGENEKIKEDPNVPSIVETVRAINQVLKEEGWKEEWEKEAKNI